MTAHDPHRFVNELEDADVERLIDRLESRAKDRVFTRLFRKYVARLRLPPAAQVLEVGCGTGAMTRCLARSRGFSGKAFGIDQSPAFIEAARRFAREEDLSDRVEFRVGDAHSLEFPSEEFDAVFVHTVISHVTKPPSVLREMARVVRRGGTAAIFDGDYASLTYACSDHSLGRRMNEALVKVTFNNPFIVRDLPRLLPESGLTVRAAWGDAVAEIGKGSFFKSFAELYVLSVKKAGLLSADAIEAWLAVQRRAMENGTFFASCNYYTFLARRT
jgi:SAM-dependent methyltransferase